MENLRVGMNYRQLAFYIKANKDKELDIALDVDSSSEENFTDDEFSEYYGVKVATMFNSDWLIAGRIGGSSGFIWCLDDSDYDTAVHEFMKMVRVDKVYVIIASYKEKEYEF